MPSKYSSSRRKMETRALRFTSCTSLSWRKMSASSRRSIAFQVTAYSNTSLSLTSKFSGSVPRSPQLMVKRGHLCFSATHSAVSVLPVPGGPFYLHQLFLRLFTLLEDAYVEQYGETSSFTAHNITKARFLQPIRFHHSFDDPLIILSYNQSPERFLPELDRLEVIYLY